MSFSRRAVLAAAAGAAFLGAGRARAAEPLMRQVAGFIRWHEG